MFYAKFRRPWRKIVFFRYLSVSLLTSVYLQYLIFKTLGVLSSVLFLLLFARSCLPVNSGAFCLFIHDSLKKTFGQGSAVGFFVFFFGILIYGIGFFILRYFFLKILCPHCGNRFFIKGWKDLPARLGFPQPPGWRCVNCRIPVGFDFENRTFKLPETPGVFLREKVVEFTMVGGLIVVFSLILGFSAGHG